MQIYVPSGRHGASAALILMVVAGASGTRSRLAQQRVRTGAAETVRETRLNSHEICCTNRCSQERCSAAHAVLSPTYNQCLDPPTTYFPVRPQERQIRASVLGGSLQLLGLKGSCLKAPHRRAFSLCTGTNGWTPSEIPSILVTRHIGCIRTTTRPVSSHLDTPIRQASTYTAVTSKQEYHRCLPLVLARPCRQVTNRCFGMSITTFAHGCPRQLNRIDQRRARTNLSSRLVFTRPLMPAAFHKLDTLLRRGATSFHP